MKKIDINDIKSCGKFAVILKCLLAKNKITQGELASAVGLSKATITHYVKGKFTPSQANLEKIASYLNVSPRVFYGDIEEYYPYLNSVEAKFAKKLSELIKAKNITQEQLAKEIGVSRQTINFYVNGKQLPMTNIMINMAKYFDTSVGYFLNEEESEDNQEVKIVVTEMPIKKNVCPFIKANLSSDTYECWFGGVCNLDNMKCSHLSEQTK